VKIKEATGFLDYVFNDLQVRFFENVMPEEVSQLPMSTLI